MEKEEKDKLRKFWHDIIEHAHCGIMFPSGDSVSKEEGKKIIDQYLDNND